MSSDTLDRTAAGDRSPSGTSPRPAEDAPADKITVDETGLEKLAKASEERNRIYILAALIDQTFRRYYAHDLGIPERARQAFEARDWPRSVALSDERIKLYGSYVDALEHRLTALRLEADNKKTFWNGVESAYRPLIRGEYHADLAFAFLNSVRRRTTRDAWRAIPYTYTGEEAARLVPPAAGPTVIRRFPVDSKIDTDTVRRILEIPGFTAPYADLDGDAEKVRSRIAEVLSAYSGAPRAVDRVEMIDGTFFRNRGAYLVGRIVLRTGPVRPLALALLHERDGIFVDAVLMDRHDLFHVFSSTRANFHVTNPHYHELVTFLYGLMPERPKGLHYSTIGYNHAGKMAVMDQITEELDGAIARQQPVLGTAPGFEGTVAIGFSAPGCSYVLKVIRDHPTRNYKWGQFPGIEAVLDKYRLVHEINRTGSMLDNAIYNHLGLPAAWFDPALLDQLLTDASENVSRHGDRIVFQHLIVQRKLVPVTEFMKTATPEAAARVMQNLGLCIKNNAAADIFNKDLDARNYGVGESHKVYLFDYDALEPLAEVKIRTNQDRDDGDEDVPDWFFEDGHIFLPEELEVGLCLDSRPLRQMLRDMHGDLMTTAYWEDVQRQLAAGKVPRISTYLDARRLPRHGRRPEPAPDYWGA